MLYKTYENNMGRPSDNDENTLSAIAHTTANAQIEIMVTEDGEFYSAQPVAKSDANFMIPVTEKSEGRCVGIAPHPLCDTLSYIASDFKDYLESEKDIKKADNKHTAYINQLKSWVDSEYTHPKIQAIYSYLENGKVIDDLIKSSIIELNEDGKFADKKVQGNVYEKCLVRFMVLSDDFESETAVWKDAELINKYTKFYLSFQSGRKDICYLTGEESVVSENHPKGIIQASYGAKLISANDKTNFTYRGRFKDSNEAVAVSYEATQKAHSALKWLAKKQGVNFAGRTYICWNPDGKKVPKFERVGNFEGTEQDEIDTLPDTQEKFRQYLIETRNGYTDKLNNNDDILIIGLDAATTGRLSVTYYNELKGSDFLDRLDKWGDTLSWYFRTKSKTIVQTPLIWQIVNCAFGTQQGEFIKADEKLMKEHSQRILYCMLNDKPIPLDIVRAISTRASNPQAYKSGSYSRLLSTACAVISKYYRDKGEDLKMTLDYENADRSYLFGRLLAVAELVERSTYSNDEKREPNAIRYQSMFYKKPLTTWTVIHESLAPYFQKLTPGSRKYFKDIIGEIFAAFKQEDENNMNKPLGEKYLIGYYLQRKELYTKKSEKVKTEEEV